MDPNAGKLFDFDKEKYDVIIIGDVTAAQMKAIRPDVLTQINQQVDSGAGFLMIGGYSSFGEGDWQGTPVEPLLPVDLSVRGQVRRRPVRNQDGADGGSVYGFIATSCDLGGGDAKAERDDWDALPGLDGVNRIAQPKPLGPTDQVLAVSKELDPQTMRPYPLLVTKDYGNGAGCWLSPATRRTAGSATRTASANTTAFGGKWCCGWPGRTRATTRCASTPDVRSLSVGDDLGFSLGMRSKNGLEVKDADYEVEVVGPNGERKKVTPTRDGGEDRGVYRPETAGHIHDQRQGPRQGLRRPGGERRRLGAVLGVRGQTWRWPSGRPTRSSCRSWPTRAAASSGAGRSWRRSWTSCRCRRPRRRSRRWTLAPDWSSASWSPFLVVFFVLFTGLLAGEWFLRRRWGMA